MNKYRSVTEAMKKLVAGRQRFRCANKPGANLERIESYKCPLWILETEDKGLFDESGYDIDHIREFSLTGDNNITNLQALCKSCHAVKTRIFLQSNERPMKRVKDGKRKVKDVIDDVSIDEAIDEENDCNEPDTVSEDSEEVIVVESPFKCPKCGNGFTTKQNLQYHTSHNACNKPHECKYCRKHR